MPQLDPTTFISQIFWLFICFAFIVIYSAKVTLPQLDRVFHHRYNKIEGIEAITLTLQNQIEHLNDERQQHLIKARHYSHDHVIQTMRHLNKQFTQTKQSYRSEMKQQLRTYELQLSTVEPLALNDLEVVSLDLPQLIMDKISLSMNPRLGKNNSTNKASIIHES